MWLQVVKIDVFKVKKQIFLFLSSLKMFNFAAVFNLVKVKKVILTHINHYAEKEFNYSRIYL